MGMVGATRPAKRVSARAESKQPTSQGLSITYGLHRTAPQVFHHPAQQPSPTQTLCPPALGL
eukprot:9704994-Alexandrium_andersonii.AAC.1